MGEQPKELIGPDFAAGIDLEQLRDSEPLLGHAHGEPVVVVRQGDLVSAVGASCTHYGGPLSEGLVVGETLRCPWHHARFNLKTGEAVGAPALNPIGCFEVTRNAGRITVGARKPVPTRSCTSGVPVSVVVIGSGAAGAAAVETLRREGYRGPVTMVGGEAPVDRPNLSKDYLAGTAPEEWIPLRPPEFYRELEVDLVVGDEAVGLDPQRHEVTLKSGRRLTYGALLLAPGAEPVRLPIPGADLPHVRTLRTLEDSRAIIRLAAQAKQVVIIGASFIGLEVAASLRHRGLPVQVVAKGAIPLERILGREVGRFLQALHVEHGVNFHLQTGPRSISATQVELENGQRLDADLVVMGVGVRPRVALAQAAGLWVDNGVVVDAQLRTGSRDIWAAGDVARLPDARSGELVRIEHWVFAERQGQAAARSILGRGTSFRDLPFFWSAHYDVVINVVGHAASWDALDIQGSLEAREATVVFRRGAVVLQVATIGRDRVSLAAEAAMERADLAALVGLLGRASPG
jgi:NADPH-dependent 2,4-dienoyl-CoA reductase/sulfur reductase-like enzyme/nitrite reductase/ring-hydroxylating ferredoxin subunit